ncbi:MAG TPA: hypothetical protein VGT44_10215 [Ktedonobacteraceae bacterium]|nr:hypothetical protein [Ktedonobacteraceae bacterium]
MAGHPVAFLAAVAGVNSVPAAEASAITMMKALPAETTSPGALVALEMAVALEALEKIAAVEENEQTGYTGSAGHRIWVRRSRC